MRKKKLEIEFQCPCGREHKIDLNKIDFDFKLVDTDEGEKDLIRTFSSEHRLVGKRCKQNIILIVSVVVYLDIVSVIVDVSDAWSIVKEPTNDEYKEFFSQERFNDIFKIYDNG